VGNHQTPKYAAVILAAGLSNRMGRFKPLLPLGNETVAGRLIATFLDAGIDIFMVTGHRADELRTGLQPFPVTFIDNPDYEDGMLTSVQAGLAALPGEYAGAFIAPVDVPLVSPETVRRLLLAYTASPGRIVIPAFNGKKGHPPLLPSALFAEIRSEPRDSNLRNILHRHADSTVLVPVTDPNIIFDIDRSGDYAELLARYEAVAAGREKHGTAE